MHGPRYLSVLRGHEFSLSRERTHLINSILLYSQLNYELCLGLSRTFSYPHGLMLIVDYTHSTTSLFAL